MLAASALPPSTTWRCGWVFPFIGNETRFLSIPPYLRGCWEMRLLLWMTGCWHFEAKWWLPIQWYRDVWSLDPIVTMVRMFTFVTFLRCLPVSPVFSVHMVPIVTRRARTTPIWEHFLTGSLPHYLVTADVSISQFPTQSVMSDVWKFAVFTLVLTGKKIRQQIP